MVSRAYGLLQGLMEFLGRAFKPAARYPADPRAVFLLALSVFTGLAAFALDAAPQTLNSILPHWATLTWGALLVLGSVTALCGMRSQTADGITAEQIGSVIVGATCVFYSGIALKVGGPDVLQPIGIVMAWGIACFMRWGQLQALVNQAYAQKVEELTRAVVAEERRRE